MTVIPDRVIRVQVGLPGVPGTQWSDLHIDFEVEKVSGSTPNKARVAIKNLSDWSIQWLEQPSQVLHLMAGEGVASPLFYGDVARGGVKTEQSGPDVITTIEAASGRRVYRETLFSASYPAGVTRSVVFADILAALQLPRGYVSPTLLERTYPSSIAFHCKARAALTRIWSPDGAQWSIQDKAVQVLAQGDTVAGAGVVISAATGMLGSPTRTDKGITVKHTLTPSLQGGSVVSVQSLHVTGFYKVAKLTQAGTNFDSKWESRITGVPYK